MKKLDLKLLENIIEEKIIGRQIIDDSQHERVIEKVTMNNRNIFVKYGSDEHLLKEITIYEEIFKNDGKYPTPQLFLSKKVNGIYFLALEWIDGIHPNFRNREHIELVFKALGKWAAEWSEEIENDLSINTNSLNNFKVLDDLLRENRMEITHMLGNSTINLLENCLGLSMNILKTIKKAPLTLDPGDVSLHNFIINSNKDVVFIDFESCIVSPMITLVEHLGEDYESIPHINSDIDLALNNYLDSWNTYSKTNISRDEFIQCQLCARINYKIGNFNYWIDRILKNVNSIETLELIKQGHKELEVLLKKPFLCSKGE